MKISVIKIIKSDYASMLFLIIPIVMVILYIDSAYIGILHLFLSKGRSIEMFNPSVFLIMSIASLCIFIPILMLRIRNISLHFQNGIVVKGKIASLNLWKDRGRIEYVYKINGKRYLAGNAVHRGMFVNSLSQNQEISIVVSKDNHKKAFIKDLYISN